jgi:hypothetical protein
MDHGEKMAAIRALHLRGFRAWRDPFSGLEWVVSLWDDAQGGPVGAPVVTVKTRREVWQRAIERLGPAPAPRPARIPDATTF